MKFKTFILKKATMSHLLQSAYIAILNPLYQLTGKISETIRNCILFFLSLVIFTYFIFKRSSILTLTLSIFLPTTFERHVFGMVILILFSIISINQPLQHIAWKNTIFIPQFLMGLGMVIIGFIHPIGLGYKTFGFMLLLVFPCLYFVWNNRRDYEHLFSILVYAMLVVNLGLFLYTCYCATQGGLIMQGPRCTGIMGNSNSYSLLGLEIVLGAFYLLVVKQFKWPLFLLSCSAIGVGLGIIFTGQMRLAIIILILSLLSSLIFVIKYKHVEINKRLLSLSFLGLFIVSQLLILSVSLVPINSAAVVSNTVAVQEATGQTTEQPSSQSTEPQESSSLVDRFSLEGKDANTFSSGRVVIWENYAKELNFWGHNFDDYDVITMTGGAAGPYAHNIFLEIGYRCGIPIGLLSVYLILATGIMALRYLFYNKKRELYLLFPIFCVISYSVTALLDIASLPFVLAETLLFYFAMIVFIDPVPGARQ